MIRTGTAHYEGLGKAGKGSVSTQSGVLDHARYDFNTRFENEPGTNPEELVAAAHASCFTMALSFALAGAGYTDGTLDTKAAVTLDKDDGGFSVTKSALTLTAEIPGISQDEFDTITAGAKANCPISKLLKCEITLDATLAS
jgi:osmotically inducible protein OsmC